MELGDGRTRVTPIVNVVPGLALLYQRKYDRAIEELQKTLEFDPNHFVTHFFLGQAYLHTGDYGKAIAAFKQGNMASWADGHLGYAYAVSGETEKARELIEAIQAGSQPEYLAPYHLAVIWLGLGEKDEALERLSQACDLRSSQLFWIKNFPEFDSVRDDPRFRAVLRRMNLAD